MAVSARAEEFDADHTEDSDRLISHNIVLRENLQAVACIKDAIQSEDYYSASQVWLALSEEIRNALWVAPTKGGIFTTAERQLIQKNEFLQAEE